MEVELLLDNLLIKIDGEIGPMLVTSPNTQVNWVGGAKHIVAWTVNRTMKYAILSIYYYRWME